MYLDFLRDSKDFENKYDYIKNLNKLSFSLYFPFCMKLPQAHGQVFRDSLNKNNRGTDIVNDIRNI